MALSLRNMSSLKLGYTMKGQSSVISFLGALVAAALFVSTAQAQLAYRVSMDTSALVGHPAGSFFLDFQLNDGEGWGNGNNTAVLSNFTFGSGGATGSATTFGGASGDLWSAVTLTDT